MATPSSSATQAVRTTDFTNSIGINTHIDFTWTAYGNTQVVINSINYIGIKNVRDSANNPTDIGANGLWQQVANATGVTFDAFIGQGSPATMQTGLQYIQQLAPQNIIAYIEGGNEQDGAYPASLGNTLAITALFQQQVYDVGVTLNLPVINMSFGAGWDTNPTSGNYGTVGDLSAFSNFANAHTYFGTGNTPSYNINWVNGLAQMSSNHPVITTEMGWYTTGNVQDATSVSETVQAKYMLDALMYSYKAGNVKTYLYELLDQKTGDGYSENNFGLFHSDGTPKLAATALHNLTTLLADTGTNSASFVPGTLAYSLSGMQATDNSLLMGKSDGSYWLSIWNEERLSSSTSSTDITVPNHNVTLTLDGKASSIIVFDPLTGTSAVQALSDTQTAQISVPAHPVLIKIIPAPTLGNDLSVSVPASLSAAANGVVQVPVSISDAWAATNPGVLTLNLTVTNGTLSMTDTNGQTVAGSGSNAIHVSGSLAELNADLATLKFHAPASVGTGTISVDVWNQAGVEVMKSTTVGVTLDSSNLSVSVPTTLSAAANGVVQVPVSISDAWAASNPGVLSLNLTATSGTLLMTDTNGVAVAGSGSNAIHISGSLAELNADLATLRFHAPTSVGTDTISVDVWNQAGVEVMKSTTIGVTLDSNDMSIETPASVSLAVGQTVQVGGISVIDPWAASNPGFMALNLSVTSGTLTMTDTNGQAVIGSGTNGIHFSGTLAQLDSGLTNLSYHAPTAESTGHLSVNAWNQAGVNTTQTIALNNLLPGNVMGTHGNDTLSATSGHSLTGNGGADTFYFTMSNTGTGAAADHIADFSQASGDKINLHGFGLTAVDFNSSGTLSGSKSLTFQQIMDGSNHPYTEIMINTKGDHISDYEILLDNTHVNLNAGDFIFT